MLFEIVFISLAYLVSSQILFLGMCLIWKEKKARSNVQVLNVSNFFNFFFLASV